MSERDTWIEALTKFKQEWEAGREPVTIPRAQHKALMAAAEQLVFQHRDYYGKSDGRCEACKAIAALCAAGILEGEPND